ncbi:MAG: SH3 domain-containing protein [Oscillospiraceae bacterium]
MRAARSTSASPGTNYGSIGSAQPGERFVYLGEADGGWRKIQFGGRRGLRLRRLLGSCSVPG